MKWLVGKILSKEAGSTKSYKLKCQFCVLSWSALEAGKGLGGGCLKNV